jgi:predicted O-methyltransferase YrrM
MAGKKSGISNHDPSTFPAGFDAAGGEFLRNIRHWTPRYILDRSREKFYRASHPDTAWLTPAANAFLDSWLRKEDLGLEFGSGRSTLWFARRVGMLDSVEHQAGWHARVSEMLAEAGLENVRYHLHPRDADDNPGGSDYMRVVEGIAAQSLDFVLVDGIYREYCARAALDKLKPGGILVIDNVNLYLPCQSRCPNSVPKDGQPISPVWAEVYAVIRTWRTVWTSNGVSDTAIFIKPCAA